MDYKSLQQLNLANNDFKDPGAEAIRDLVYHNHNIWKCRTDKNNISRRIQVTVEEQCSVNKERVKSMKLPRYKAMVSHLLSIKDEETDKERCI